MLFTSVLFAALAVTGLALPADNMIKRGVTTDRDNEACIAKNCPGALTKACVSMCDVLAPPITKRDVERCPYDGYDGCIERLCPGGLTKACDDACAHICPSKKRSVAAVADQYKDYEDCVAHVCPGDLTEACDSMCDGYPHRLSKRQGFGADCYTDCVSHNCLGALTEACDSMCTDQCA